IGYSLAEQVIENKFDYYVLELSSFQLDDIEHFQPWIAVLLNITPDHLDRYNYSLDDYARAKLRLALGTFHNADHRLQLVREVNEVEYINDSKATNVEAAWYALDGVKRPIVWIAGGTDKGNDYAPLQPLAQQ
nr:UDP-N-acetylmuramoylalanine--D-glutamate ligase-like [Tanacetum cinerariifolium]